MTTPETKESLKQLCLNILSKDGTVEYTNLPPIDKATWDAFERGFMKCAEYLLTPNVETEKVCKSCQSVGITDVDCICAHQNNYPTIECEVDYCKVCGSADDY